MQSNLKREIAQTYFNRKADRWLSIVSLSGLVGFFGGHIVGYFIFFA